MSFDGLEYTIVHIYPQMPSPQTLEHKTHHGSRGAINVTVQEVTPAKGTYVPPSLAGHTHVSVFSHCEMAVTLMDAGRPGEDPSPGDWP